MKSIIAASAVMVALIIPVADAGNGGSGGQNWKTEVSQECSRLVTGARRTADAVLANQPTASHNRAQRLRIRARHCATALSHVPGA